MRARPGSFRGTTVTGQDIRVLLTVRVYDGDPAEVVSRLCKPPADVGWYTLSGGAGEFEVLAAELAEEPSR